MNYRGRRLDAVALWEQYVEFPQGMAADAGGFAPLVRCPNPDHQTDKRHFQVNLDKPLVHCFAGCGISGTYEKAIAMIEGVTTSEARKVILKHTRVGLGSASKRKVRRAAGTVARAGGSGDSQADNLDYERFIPQVGMDYLAARGVGAESIAAFGIGWDADERRIVIPAADDRGIVRFLIKRAVREQDWPKYLYAPEKAVCGWGREDLLFGACKLDLERVSSQGLVLMEGSIDLLTQYEHGFRNVVAQLGSYLSVKQAAIIHRLRPRRVFFMLDRDAAGARALIRAAERLQQKLPLFVCLYPKGKYDPAELSGKEVQHSIDNAVAYQLFLKRLPRSVRTKEVAHGRN